MPIGATIGGAVIGAGASIGSGIIGGNAQRDAAQQAADTSLQTAEINNQLQRDVYNANYGILAPYASAGYGATNMINAFLGIPQTAVPQVAGTGGGGSTGGGALGGYAGGPLSGGSGSVDDWSRIQGYLTDNVSNNFDPAAASYIRSNLDRIPTSYTGPSWDQIQTYATDNVPGNYEKALNVLGSAIAGNRPATPAPTTGGTPGTGTGAGGTGTATDPTQAALKAFDTFKQGTLYNWRLGQGAELLNSKYAANQMFESGAADKALVQYGQNFASQELGNFMSLLGQQQSLGVNAAGAIAGVGNTFANNTSANNLAAGNAAASAALANGQAQASMWGSIGSGIGQLGGALYQYGTGQFRPATAPMTAGAAPINVTPNYNIPWGGGLGGGGF